ncbi:unnamed protein product [Kuraishia capsulata CBS 1993]|uniref:DNA repair protein RAD14 n=1 Tax=Kuraishia capsulata CBS 1993 TaxID=1382522 RepID=W6MKS4_9ASCO|nr:uncharacterized protein KUCA_T00002611001 [Kuraishia capsulata CBS 1993]CDK26638.1 unnamed protein product [Kuraishia capsulata CBS 1993]
MQDSFGGFISEDIVGANGKKTLEEWQLEQAQKVVHEPAPPIDPSSAPKCFECGSVEIDRKVFDVFGTRVCKRCKELKPEKYSLLTKTECREDYFLTDPELKDESLLKRIEKANPYSGTYSRMLLFMRYQVEEFAFKKWGGEEGLDAEWERREKLRIKRRDTKFEKNLREIRRKTRAEQITRRHRERNGGLRHEHEWSQPLESGTEGMIKRRCTDCGMETEEFLL